MVADNETYENEADDILEPGPPGHLKCRYCPDTFRRGPDRYNHERSYHPEEFRRDSPNGRARGGNSQANSRPQQDDVSDWKPVTIAGVRMDTVHELTRKFAETLDNVAHDMNPGKKKQIILAFDDVAYTINQDRGRLERFLNRCGISASQAEYIKLVLLGLDDDKPHWGDPSYGPGGMRAMTWDPQTGRMAPAPIFLMGGNNGPGYPPSQPIMFMSPWGAGGGQEDRLTRRDLEEYVDRVAERLQASPAPQHPDNPNVREYQRPVVGHDGKVVVDERTGQPLMAWVREPIDPLSDAINKLSALGVFGKPEAPPAVSAAEIGKSVAEQLQPLLPQKEENKEVLELRKDFQEYIHRNDLKEAQQSGARVALEEYQRTIQPYLDELKDLRGRTGLTDRQYELRHQEESQRNLLGAVGNALNGLREDLQPLAVQNMVATMKAMGISDNTINETIRRLPTPGARAASAVEEDLRARVMEQWVSE